MSNLFEELRFYTSASALVDHWLDLRKPGQSCPYKTDFSPMRMGKMLPDVFMVEWQDDDHVMIRVAGSRTTDVTQEDATGQNMLDICLPEHRAAMRDFYRKMRSGQFAGVTEHALSRTPAPSTAKGLQFPLLDENGDARFFVGVTKAVPMRKCQEDFRVRSENAPVSLNVWFSNLSVHSAPLDAKIG